MVHLLKTKIEPATINNHLSLNHIEIRVQCLLLSNNEKMDPGPIKLSDMFNKCKMEIYQYTNLKQ